MSVHPSVTPATSIVFRERVTDDWDLDRSLPLRASRPADPFDDIRSSILFTLNIIHYTVKIFRQWIRLTGDPHYTDPFVPVIIKLLDGVRIIDIKQSI